VAIRRYLGDDMQTSAVQETKVKLGSVDMEKEEEDEGRGSVIPFLRALQGQSDASF
jgi:hypothetical protein